MSGHLSEDVRVDYVCIGEDGHVETANPFFFTIVRGWMIRLEIFGSLPKDARSTRVRGIR